MNITESMRGLLDRLDEMPELKIQYVLVHDANGDMAFIVDSRMARDLIQLIEDDKYPEGPSAGDFYNVIGDREPDDISSGGSDSYPISLNIFKLSDEEVSRLISDDDEWDDPDYVGITTAQDIEDGWGDEDEDDEYEEEY